MATTTPPSPTTVKPVTYGHDVALATFSLAGYQKMVEVGILTSEDKVELLENYVVYKMPRSPLHDATLNSIHAHLWEFIPSGWLLRNQLTVVLSDSQPEPDLAIVRGTSRSFLTRHPGSAEVGLLIEVADSSLLRDQRDKTRIYARAGIACYWILNLVDGQIEVYTQPTGPTAVPSYGACQTYQPGGSIPLMLGGTVLRSFAVADLLP